MSRRRRLPSDDEAPMPPRPSKRRQLKEDLNNVQNELLEEREMRMRAQEENENLRQQVAHRGDQPESETASEGNVSRSDLKSLKKAATVAGRRAGPLYAPFLEVDALSDQKVQDNIGTILEEVRQAQESDNELEDDVNPAKRFENPWFDIPDTLDIVREMLFSLPKSPGKRWLDDWFQEKVKLGLRKQRGDIVHAVAKHYEKVFDIHDSDFEDRKKRSQMPEVQELSATFLHISEDDPLETFFRHNCIVRRSKVLRLLLNGPAAILSGHRSAKTRKSHAEQWNIQCIIPSLLAFAATVIKFVLSGEPSFEEASGSVNYSTWFVERLKLLEGIYHNQPDVYNDLIDYYNRAVLPNRYRFEEADNQGDHNNDQDDPDSGLGDAERAFLARIRGDSED
ncbi:hypothetical protein RhiJN_19960 [Ceratobasidium sp. AG-Ba]|nr:hypothetical protein RhiJN_19960 [Ceratobasidium sp. AG-Ba]